MTATAVWLWATTQVLAPSARPRYGVAAAVPEEEIPLLQRFSIRGTLLSNLRMAVPFDPPFEPSDHGLHRNFQCYLDFAMGWFTLTVDAKAPSVLSKVNLDGEPVPTRDNLSSVEIAPGERLVYSIGVTWMRTVYYTLIVVRRRGSSTELLGLRPITSRLQVPFQPGELQAKFELEQAFYEDLFDVEYDFADGGQNITCHVESGETIGGDAPSRDDIAESPNKYLPSLEQLHRVAVKREYNPHSPGAGPTDRCIVPIDTWRRIFVGLHIESADQRSKRTIQLVVSRKGCTRGKFYDDGRCSPYCPSYHYEQRFNWCCGRCPTNCEFCEHWHYCYRCHPDTVTQKYMLNGNGSCTVTRIHRYRVYYDFFFYLSTSCAALVSLYCLVCTFMLVRRIYQEELSDDEEEAEPLTSRDKYLSTS